MDWLRWFFLESFAPLAVVLFLVNFFLLVYWRRGGRARPLVVGLAASAAMLLVQTVVVTRHERADRILDAIERDVLLGRLDALAAAMAQTFDSDGMDRDEFLAFAREQLDRIRVDSLRRTRLQIGPSSPAPGPSDPATGRSGAEAEQSAPASFVATAVYFSDVRLDAGGGRVKTRWDVMFVREASRWRIGGVRLVELNGQPISSIRDVRP